MNRCRLLAAAVALAACALAAGGAGAEWTAGAKGLGEPVPHVAPGKEWNRFLILVWQYKTSLADDLPLYKRAGFRGFHIDRGAGREKTVALARRLGTPYYNDHAADKGYLHLTPRTGRDKILRKRTLVERPWSLAEPKTMRVLKDHLRKNVSVTRRGPVVAYAFDDEISVTSFNSPAEVDASPASVAAYRKWLAQTYARVDRLNAQWGTSYGSFSEAEPISFEDIRNAHTRPPLARWNLSQWMDWRSYMDTQFADCLAELARFTNGLDAATPAGFVGGQQPSVYGGYDYAKLCRSVQWMEAYDIGGTNEILRSLWRHRERRPRVQTWFSSADPKRDAWFLWYYLVHGCRGVIAWPARGGESWFHWKGEGLAPFIVANAETIREVQGPVSEPILDLDARFDADPVAVYHSHPSIQASWAMDCVPHGRTWPNRSSSLDNSCQTQGRNRTAWFKLLEDCGVQYSVVTAGQVARGELADGGYRLLVLRRAICLSNAEVEAIRRFVEGGGTVVADHLCGLLDEHGKGRDKGALDDLFGIRRDEAAGYLDGASVAEINGEKYRQPLLQRLAYDGARRWRGIVVYERGTSAARDAEAAGRVAGADVLITRRVGKGRAIYLNLTPLAYNVAGERLGDFGRTWRQVVSVILARAGIQPRARVVGADGEPIPMAETIFYRNGGRRILCVVKNPGRDAGTSAAGPTDDVFGEPTEIRITLADPAASVRDLRTGKTLPRGREIRATWKPWEALVFELTRPAN